MEMIPLFGIVASSATIVIIIYLVTRSRTRRMELQVEMQGRLIDRFGTAPELVEFLHSPAGQQFVAGVQGSREIMTRDRIISGFTRAIVLTMLGLAFLGLTFVVEDNFAIPAAILLSLGIAYLLATFVSYRLSSHLGGGTAREV
jgi:hypothetical protein